jgi:hypothetical protein
MTMQAPMCQCEWSDDGCPVHGTRYARDELRQAERARDAFRAERDQIEAATVKRITEWLRSEPRNWNGTTLARAIDAKFGGGPGGGYDERDYGEDFEGRVRRSRLPEDVIQRGGGHDADK